MNDTEPDQQDETDAGDEQPAMGDGEMVDIPDDVAAEIEEQTASEESSDGDADESSESSDSREENQNEQQGTQSTSEPASDRTTPGDIYCNGLGMVAAVGRTKYGTADDSDRSDLVEEYGEIARDLDIDSYIDELLEERGGIDELSPGQAVMLTTLMWGGMVCMDDPEMLEEVADA